MKAPETETARWHEDRELFRTALSFTATRTGFAERLIEKDYFCTVVLDYLAGVEGLVFKGGTCLAKVHAAFYRLSEDLDFVIPMQTEATRRQRSARTATLKRAISELPARLPMLRVVEPLRGANESAQYLATVAYASMVSGDDEAIKIEIGLREPLLEPPVVAPAATVVLNPVTNSPLVAPVEVVCMSLREALAEKTRAALSRREAAIRDFFDLDYAARVLRIGLAEPAMIELAKAKLAVPGNGPVDVSADRLSELRAQVDAQLRPVLRPADFEAFDLDRAFRIASNIAAALGKAR
jgi:predicted nucleotidyltransferase component of viral defense system